MYKSLSFVFGMVFLSLGLLPQIVEAQPTPCYYCHPQQGPDGSCRRSADGWTGCDPAVGGGCDFRDYKNDCGRTAFLSPDHMTLDGGKVIRGKWLDSGVFGVRSCTGEQLGVIYTADQIASRRALAGKIKLTLVE